MTPDYRALCSHPLAQEAYVAFVQICKGGSDDAGTYDADEEIVRRALKRLDELESALLAEPEAEGPSASDVTELFYRHMGEGSEVGFENAIAEALSRWGRPAAAPVPAPRELEGVTSQ